MRLNFPGNLRAVEAVCIELTVASRERILCVYRPPNCSNHYNENMCEMISYCSRNMTNVIILGDFNLPLIDWSNNVSPITQQYNSFSECISENVLTEHVHFPTRGDNTLALILTVDPLNVTQVNAASNFQFLDNVSDHVAIVFSVNSLDNTQHNPPRNIMKVTIYY